jgi:hypothetical protein
MANCIPFYFSSVIGVNIGIGLIGVIVILFSLYALRLVVRSAESCKVAMIVILNILLGIAILCISFNL